MEDSFSYSVVDTPGLNSLISKWIRQAWNRKEWYIRVPSGKKIVLSITDNWIYFALRIVYVASYVCQELFCITERRFVGDCSDI